MGFSISIAKRMHRFLNPRDATSPKVGELFFAEYDQGWNSKISEFVNIPR
jgi:hypothetical protein